jgi:hypothetical protein
MLKLTEEASEVNGQSDAIDQTIKKDRVWHKFSPELAIKLNPKEPDIMAATILYGLNLWMCSGNQLTNKEGGNCCYRSLSDLAIDYPYWTESGIEHALLRAEERLKGKFWIRRDKKVLWFYMDPKFRKQLAKLTRLMFRIQDATAYGVVKALLLSNLSWQFQQPRGFEVDECDNKYGELSPTKLTTPDEDSGEQIIPKSYKTISRALNELCILDKVLSKHPKKSGLYTFLKTMNHGSKNDNRNGTKRDSDRTKRDTDGTIRDDLLCAYSNKIVNRDSKDKSFAEPALASPPQLSEESTPCRGLEILRNCANEHLIALRKYQTDRLPSKPATVPPSLLPYDDFTGVKYDLPYDDIPIRVKGRITTRSQEIDLAIDIIKTNWRTFSIHYSKRDLAHLRQFFCDNSFFKVEHWHEIESAIAEAKAHTERRKGEWINGKISKKVKTATARLRYLPQIVQEMFIHGEWGQPYNADLEVVRYDGEMPEPFASLDYSYLGRGINSRLIEDYQAQCVN